MTINQLNQLLGNVDLYLLDHILKGRFEPGMTILDAGCGEGRNLMYFLQSGYQVYGVDRNPEAIRLLKFLVKSKWPDYPVERFKIEDIQSLSWKTPFFDLIISSAVLHFAEHHHQFWAMMDGMFAALNPGGMLFCRMASALGVQGIEPTSKPGWFHLPDGSERFLLTADLRSALDDRYDFEWVEPLKTVVVDGQRAMATLLLRKL